MVEKQMDNDSWESSASDLQWCRNLIGMINDGGVWGTSAGAYQIDKANKKLTLITRTYIPGTYEAIHLRNVKAFKAIGWEVIDGTEDVKFDVIIADLT